MENLIFEEEIKIDVPLLDEKYVSSPFEIVPIVSSLQFSNCFRSTDYPQFDLRGGDKNHHVDLNSRKIEPKRTLIDDDSNLPRIPGRFIFQTLEEYIAT